MRVYAPLALVLLAPTIALPTVALAALPNGEALCGPDDPALDADRYLRAVTLDVAGRLPTDAERAAVAATGEVPEALIDELLISDAFVERAVRFHRSVLWNNVSNIDLLNFQAGLSVESGTNLYWRRTYAFQARGDGVPCRDVPATFDANGNIQVETDALGIRREGYVMVRPYWAPTTELKVCAFDAQTAARSPRGNDCTMPEGLADPGCGCGPNLRLCRTGVHNPAVTRALGEDIDRRVAALIRADEPYLELFNSRRAYVNGPLVHFYRHQLNIPAGATFKPLGVDQDRLPDLEWTDADRWTEIELDDAHAGVLTSPAWLLRFQTNRARAAHWMDAMLCAPVSPPAAGFPPIDVTERPNPDLQQRDGCKYCHALLEPTGAYWARWTERGAGFLDTTRFPAMREDCRRCAEGSLSCSAECRQFYTVRGFSAEERPYFGMLNGYQFLRQEHFVHAEAGPKLLVASAEVDERFPRCVARRAFQGLLGRGLSVEEESEVEELARAFVASGHRWPALIKAIVTNPAYRRVR